jgi:transposase
MDWAKSPELRDQMVLFPSRLDDAIGPQHNVRLLDEILGRLDWSKWESGYDLTRGQPPIHPRVLASVILYGLLTRIRSSRALEEALQVRLDFRWLVEGRSIDHTTLSEFRRKNAVALKDSFVQIGLIAREMGWLKLETLAFDGTRMRANNRRTGTRTPAQLREMKQELAAKFAELEAQSAAADTQEDEVFGTQSSYTLSDELADVERRRQKVDAALAEIERLEHASETVPPRLPITDPQSRVMPNKEGGFAPNYTPLATVDVDSGLIVSADVISNSDEDKHLLPAIEDVQEQFQLQAPPAEVLADAMMATGENLAACQDREIALYAPLAGQHDADNPALRDDPTQPVSPEDCDRLPTKTIRRHGEKHEQLDKQAFVYDADQDCYWCPQGKQLPYLGTSSETRKGQRCERRRYKASAEDCTDCPLRDLCLQGNAKQRTLSREQYESQRVAHGKKMSTPEAQKKYSRRRHPGERPFAVIKHQFGARRFLTRGIEQVQQEWLWLSSAFNLHRLMGLIRSGVDPPLSGCRRLSIN